jgi:hypothetical protein
MGTVNGHRMGTIEAHTGLKNLEARAPKWLILVPGAGIEPARTLPDPRDFKSRVSTKFHHPGTGDLNSLLTQLGQPLFRKLMLEPLISLV